MVSGRIVSFSRPTVISWFLVVVGQRSFLHSIFPQRRNGRAMSFFLHFWWAVRFYALESSNGTGPRNERLTTSHTFGLTARFLLPLGLSAWNRRTTSHRIRWLVTGSVLRFQTEKSNGKTGHTLPFLVNESNSSNCSTAVDQRSRLVDKRRNGSGIRSTESFPAV